MVEVLKRGTPPADVVYEVRCIQCKSQLSFKRSEAKCIHDQRDGDYLTITCPVCQHEVTRDARPGNSLQPMET